MYNSGPNGSKRNVDTYTINADGSITRRLYTEPGDGDSTVYEQTYSQGNDDYGVELKYLNQHLDNLEEKINQQANNKEAPSAVKQSNFAKRILGRLVNKK